MMRLTNTRGLPAMMLLRGCRRVFRLNVCDCTPRRLRRERKFMPACQLYAQSENCRHFFSRLNSIIESSAQQLNYGERGQELDLPAIAPVLFLRGATMLSPPASRNGHSLTKVIESL